MKISLNWVKEFTDVKVSVDELVAKIGAQLGEVEEVVSLGERYEGIVVAKVISCRKHPNADKLSVCKVDDGGKTSGVKRDKDGLMQVVCGAPNVRAGITVAWIPPGAIVPSTYDKERFKLDVRPLRGVDSNGMLASAKELGISDDHDGIMILDMPAKPGTPLTKVYDLDDYIVDIENKMFTHRPDCFGILGVAREIAGIQGIRFKSPDWYLKLPNYEAGIKSHENLKLTVRNEIPSLVARFMAVALSGIEVKKSPLAMQSYLTRVGIKPINNVVDVTNFMMVLTGQPLHAYDYDKVAAQDKSQEATLVVRKPKKGEKITLLGGKTITPRSDAAMIATNTRLIGIGGVMGGQDTEVDESTTNIILECANFDLYNIRRTSMEHGLFTDAVTRFNKGQSPLQNDRVLAHAMQWLGRHAGARVAGPVIDKKASLPQLNPISVSADFINTRLGETLPGAAMAKLLSNVEFTVHGTETLSVTPPFWRTDIEIPEDIVEEVGRLYGYDHLPLTLPSRTLTPPTKNELLTFKSKLRQVLSSAGANEVLTYSFVHGDLMKKVGQNPEHAFKITNALSPDLQYYRPSLVPSLLEKVHPNIKAGHNQFALFEINQTHSKDLMKDGLPVEEYRLGFVFAADAKTTKASHPGAPYYQAKKYLEHLLEACGLSTDKIVYEPATHEPKMVVGKQAVAPFEPKRAAYVKTADDKLLAELGEFKASAKKSLKLPEFSVGFELDIVQLLKQSSPKTYQPLNKFPSTEQDMSFKVTEKTTYQDLLGVVKKELAKLAQEHNYRPELTPVDIYQDKKAKHMTLRLSLVHPKRTLTTKETSKLVDQIAKVVKQKLNAERI